MAMQKWVVEISLDDAIIADGLDVSKQGLLHNALCRAFPLLYEHEIEVNVISAPDPDIIRRLQNGEIPVNSH